MLIVTLGGHTAEVMVLTVVAVNAMVDVDTVETIVVVEVAPRTPPKGAYSRIVASGFVPAIVVSLKSTGLPTIQPVLGEVM
jgi:hypothetical protein